MLGALRRGCHWVLPQAVLLAKQSLNLVERVTGIVESYVLLHGAPALVVFVVHCQADGLLAKLLIDGLQRLRVRESRQ